MPQFRGRHGTAAGHERDHPQKTHLIAAVHHKAHEGRNVLDVCLFKKAQTTGDVERNAACGQLHLNFQTLEMCPVQHHHVLQRDALAIAQFQHPLRDKSSLRRGIRQGHQGRLQTRATARCSQVFLKPSCVRANRSIREIQNLRHTAVIRIDRENLRTRIALRKSQDQRHVRTPPRVNRLRVIPHRHQAVSLTRQQIDHPRLDPVGVLILIDKDVTEPLAIHLKHIGMLLKQPHGQDQQIIEVHRVRLELALDVCLTNFFQFLDPVVKIGVAIRHDFLQRSLGVFHQTEH